MFKWKNYKHDNKLQDPKQPALDSVQEDCMHYFVNDIECSRDVIYTTIMNNKLYTGTIELSKKYHSKLHETQINEGYDGYMFQSDSSYANKLKERIARLHLNHNQFLLMYKPESQAHKVLIEKEIYALDIMYEAMNNYDQYAEKLRTAVRDYLTFICEHTLDMTLPYNEILGKLSIEPTVFLYDVLALGVSEPNSANHPGIPSLLNYDISSIKDNWNEIWEDSKKSQIISEDLSILLKQTETISKLWLQNDLYDKNTRIKIASIFDEMKQMIKDQQYKKDLLDTELTMVYENPSFFNNLHRFYAQSNSTRKANKPENPKNSNRSCRFC